MSKAARQHASRSLARALRACGVACALWSSFAHAQAGVEPTHEARDGTRRGVPAQAATDAANATLPMLQDASPPAASDAGALPAIRPHAAPVAGMRGVLFRVVPPRVSALPAETLDPSASGGAGAPSALPVPHGADASYLLGTIHFGTPGEQGLDDAELERTLGLVETFVNEADLDAAWKPEYDAYRWLPPEVPLSALVGKERFETARALLPKVRMQDLDRMKPWSVLALLEARGESGGEATLDARLQRMAAGAGKRVVHLETLEAQLQALDCVPALDHARVLDERLRASWILRIESAQAMAWYRARNLEAWLADIDRMEGLSEEARAIEQRARHCLLEDRNARWIGQLETLFQDGPCLVAVGAVHLAGPDGLLAALRRDGYEIEAMPL